jgi:hypothetical protein
MGPMRTTRQQPGIYTSSDPVYRLIVVIDIEGSTKRTNLVKGEIRYYLYLLLDQALKLTGITVWHLEPLTDRGDGALILIEPRDDVPKTLILGTLLPVLAALLLEHNKAMSRPDLRLRLRAVVHAGEVHRDTWGFYGDDIDTACRLLDTQGLRRTLEEAESPLALAVSEEIFKGIVQQYYPDDATYQPLGPIQVGNRSRRGWTYVPDPAELDENATIPWPRNQVSPSSVGSSRPADHLAG